MKKVIHTVPFFSQRSEHEWQERGFGTVEDAVSWQERSCGIACIKMVLDMHPEYSGQRFADMIGEMKDKGIYRERVGCVHQGIADELNARMIDAQSMKITSIERIKDLVDKGNILIVSIGVGFSDGRKSGHLVPLIGYIEEGSGVISFVVHYSSSWASHEQAERQVDAGRFMEHFSGNAIRVRMYNS